MSEEKRDLERLWAPWRMSWIRESSGGGMDGCFICEAVADSHDYDRENLMLVRGEKVIVVMNRYPYSNGHLMVAPVRHLADPRELAPEEWAEIGLMTQLTIEALDRTMHPHGYNIGWNIGRVSGAGLDTHLHQHIVPRWNGDTNFMPVIGGAKVLSQDLYESYDELSTTLKTLEKEK